MLAYHGLDYVTVLRPEVRWIISRGFGMKLVESRKRENGSGRSVPDRPADPS